MLHLPLSRIQSCSTSDLAESRLWQNPPEATDHYDVIPSQICPQVSHGCQERIGNQVCFQHVSRRAMLHNTEQNDLDIAALFSRWNTGTTTHRALPDLLCQDQCQQWCRSRLHSLCVWFCLPLTQSHDLCWPISNDCLMTEQATVFHPFYQS